MKILFTLLLIILLIRLIAPTAIRLFFFVFIPWLIKRSMHSQGSNFSGNSKTSQGTITIKQVPKQKSGDEKFKDEGDFVDYEEVK